MTTRQVQPTIAALYQRSVLDPLVEIARSVAHDSVQRPRHYRAIPDGVAALLEGFRIQTGSRPEWLSAIQRAKLFSPIFGAAFCAGSIGLRTASLAFVQRGADGGADPIDPVRDAAAGLRGYLEALEGQTLAVADAETAAVFRSAVDVLRNEAVARVFGLPAPGADWPLAWKPDMGLFDGAYLIEELQRTLKLDRIHPALTQHRFVQLQRAAHYGSLTIRGVLEEVDDDDALHALVRHAYGWENALQELLSGVDLVRAWKDPQYREKLCGCEKAMLEPHPSGEVDLKDTPLDPSAARIRVGLGFSTMTINSICCCTGDLPCPQASEGSMYCCPTATGFTCPSTECGSGCTIPA